MSSFDTVRLQSLPSAHYRNRKGSGELQPQTAGSHICQQHVRQQQPHLSKNAKDEEPEGGGNTSHTGGAKCEGNDSIVLGKHIDGRGGCATGQEAVETCKAAPQGMSSSLLDSLVCCPLQCALHIPLHPLTCLAGVRQLQTNKRYTSQTDRQTDIDLHTDRQTGAVNQPSLTISKQTTLNPLIMGRASLFNARSFLSSCDVSYSCGSICPVPNNEGQDCARIDA